MKSKIFGALTALLVAGGLAWAASTTTFMSYNLTNDRSMNDALRDIDADIYDARDSRALSTAIFCGQLGSSATVYNNLCSLDGGHADCTIGGTACNALDNATETSADSVITTNLPLTIYSMRCTVSSSGSNGVAITLRDDAADSELVCTVPTTEVDCQDSVPVTSTGIAVGNGSLFSVETVTTEDLSAQDVRCAVLYSTGDDNN